MPHSFTTERLLLRPVILRDAPAFQAIANHERMVRMTGSWSYPFTVEYARMRFALAQAWKAPTCLMAIVGPDGLLGTTSIHAGDHGRYELGYWMGQGSEGHGYATEAARGISAFAFRVLKVERLFAGVFTDNPASARVLEKTGYRRIGLGRGWSAQRKAWAPSWEFELKREGWSP